MQDGGGGALRGAAAPAGSGAAGSGAGGRAGLPGAEGAIRQRGARARRAGQEGERRADGTEAAAPGQRPRGPSARGDGWRADQALGIQGEGPGLSGPGIAAGDGPCACFAPSGSLWRGRGLPEELSSPPVGGLRNLGLRRGSGDRVLGGGRRRDGGPQEYAETPGARPAGACGLVGPRPPSQ